jgi:hypothetical protein
MLTEVDGGEAWRGGGDKPVGVSGNTPSCLDVSFDEESRALLDGVSPPLPPPPPPTRSRTPAKKLVESVTAFDAVPFSLASVALTDAVTGAAAVRAFTAPLAGPRARSVAMALATKRVSFASISDICDHCDSCDSLSNAAREPLSGSLNSTETLGALSRNVAGGTGGRTDGAGAGGDGCAGGR